MRSHVAPPIARSVAASISAVSAGTKRVSPARTAATRLRRRRAAAIRSTGLIAMGVIVCRRTPVTVRQPTPVTVWRRPPVTVRRLTPVAAQRELRAFVLSERSFARLACARLRSRAGARAACAKKYEFHHCAPQNTDKPCAPGRAPPLSMTFQGWQSVPAGVPQMSTYYRQTQYAPPSPPPQFLRLDYTGRWDRTEAASPA